MFNFDQMHCFPCYEVRKVKMKQIECLNIQKHAIMKNLLYFNIGIFKKKNSMNLSDWAALDFFFLPSFKL